MGNTPWRSTDTRSILCFTLSMTKNQSHPNMSSLWTFDNWKLILFFLDEVHIHRLRCTGDKIILRLLERRESAFYFAYHARFPKWPITPTEGPNLRVVDIAGRSNIRIEMPSLHEMHLGAKLVKLKMLLGYSSDSPFLTEVDSFIPAKVALLDSVLPSLRYLSAHSMSNSLCWTLPSKLAHFHGRSGQVSERIPLPAGLTSFNGYRITMYANSWKMLPTGLERLKMGHRTDSIQPTKLFDMPIPLERFHNLKILEVFPSAHLSRSSTWSEEGLSRMLPRGLISLALEHIPVALSPSANLSSWLPPCLTNLYLVNPIPPHFYSALPRSLTQVTFRHRSTEVAPLFWDISIPSDASKQPKLEDATQSIDINPRQHHQTDSSKIFYFDKNPILSIPPCIKHLHLAATRPYHTHASLKVISSHFTPSLTSLDMSRTIVSDSEFAYLPATLTRLLFHVVTLPKARHLSSMTRLCDLAIYGGTLTCSISKALPPSVTSLTLHHVALITKGYHHPYGYIKKHVKYSESSPQMKALSSLPSRLTSFTLVASPGHKYWASQMAYIIDYIPSDWLETLVLDMQRSNSPPLALVHTDDTTQLTKVAAFDRFKRLRYLCIGSSSVETNGVDWKKILPSHLYAVSVPYDEKNPFELRLEDLDTFPLLEYIDDCEHQVDINESIQLGSKIHSKLKDYYTYPYRYISTYTGRTWTDVSFSKILISDTHSPAHHPTPKFFF